MTISGSDLEDMVKAHMEEQPYQCTCVECGKEVEVEIKVDKDLDLKIEVYPCSCAKKE